MTDQLYCPACGPDWLGAYDMNHRCVECGVALKAEKVMERLKTVEDERDALAAHVLRICDAWAIDDTGIHDKRVDHVRLPYLRYESVNQAIMADPTTSFARLKAEWQAEALQKAADEYDPANESEDAVCAYMLDLADAYRRQAEEQP